MKKFRGKRNKLYSVFWYLIGIIVRHNNGLETVMLAVLLF